MNFVKWWFWAPIRESENVAQTIFRVLGNFLRWGVTGVVALVVFAYIGDYRSASEDRNHPRNKLEFYASFNDHEKAESEPWNAMCKPEYPLAVTVRNNSAQTLQYVDLELEARREGRSTNILDYKNREIKWDLIIPPNEAKTLCYTTSVESPETLYWSIIRKPYATTRFSNE